MRQECKNFESRTYANGETVRKCNLDLAPDAPWRCPEHCQAFEPRMDAGWTYGSMVAPPTPPEPPGLDDGTAAAILDEAERLPQHDRRTGDVGVGGQAGATQEAISRHHAPLPRHLEAMRTAASISGD